MALTEAATLALNLDREAREPLNMQLVQQLRQLILSARLARGTRLPSTRMLAADLGVSRATVVLAYDQLQSEGYIEGRHGAGMFVSTALPEQALQVAPAAPLPKVVARPETSAVVAAAKPFALGAADAGLFPSRDWARLLYRTWRDPSPSLTGAQDVLGWAGLREAIARHLREWRGISCDPGRIVVTSGTADALETIVRIAVGRGAVYVEEPGYPALRYALASYGIATVPVAVDADGFDIQAASAQGRACAAMVTPSRQFPLGGTMPLARRLALLEWAASTGGFIVEDDFDSEYRYEGTPLPALMSLDRAARTIYLGSFSKVLSPSLRLGFVVLPERLAEAARAHLQRRGTLASLIAQPALAEFISSGDYATHIRRTRRVYARRMHALVDAARGLEELLDVQPATSGMHVVADLTPRLSLRMTDRDAAGRAAKAGVAVTPLSDYFAGTPYRSSLLLGFAGFEEAQIAGAMRRLAKALA